METVQLYEIVNDTFKQSTGRTDITAIDTASFIAMGDAVLNQGNNVEPFMNTLVQRIGVTVQSFRAYDSQYQDLAFTNMQWGAIMQKIKVAMPEAIADVSVELIDGESIDHYIVAKPKSKQKLFVVRSPYTYEVTIQRDWLKEAFTSEGAMEAFIGAIFGELRNAMSLAQENLGRATMANFIANTGDTQRVHLLTEYQSVPWATTGVTGDNAIYDGGFLRYAMGRMKYFSMRLEEMSIMYNKEGETRHTPLDLQRFAIRSDYLVNMETQVEYAAFHDQYLEKAAQVKVNYWQNAKTPNDILIEGGEGEDPVRVENVLGFIHDRDALGTFRQFEEALTTPVNARGKYYNTFYHVNDARFNDLSENGIVFLVD